MASEKSFPVPLENLEVTSSSDADDSRYPYYNSCLNEANLKEHCERNNALDSKAEPCSYVNFQ